MDVGVKIPGARPKGGGDLVSGRGASDPELCVQVVDRLPDGHDTIVRRENGAMTSWQDLERAAPELAAALEGRFAAHKHALLATLRRDGSPRISGIETSFRNGELWLAMMPDSRKAADLRRTRGSPSTPRRSSSTSSTATPSSTAGRSR